MDISLLKTFLELNRTRHFGKAAKGLFLTQSAISARLKLLEDQLGVILFTRDRNNILLTPAGTRFQKHAENIVNAWNRAVQETALEDESKTLLSVGAVHNLWDTGLQEWIHFLHTHFPTIALRVEAHSQDMLLRFLNEGALDIGFMFESPLINELVVKEIGVLQLILVSTHQNLTPAQAVRATDYVMVDWGTVFSSTQAHLFPDMPPPNVRLGLGKMGLRFLLSCGGSAYLAEPMVQEYLDSGTLFKVDGAPIIQRKMYVAFKQDASRQAVINDILTYFD